SVVSGRVLPRPAGCPTALLRGLCDIDPVYPGHPRVRSGECGEDAHGTGLTGSVGAEKCGDTTFSNRHVQAVEGRHLSEPLGQPLGDDRHVHIFSPNRLSVTMRYSLFGSTVGKIECPPTRES